MLFLWDMVSHDAILTVGRERIHYNIIPRSYRHSISSKDAVAFEFGVSLGCKIERPGMHESEASGDACDDSEQDCT